MTAAELQAKYLAKLAESGLTAEDGERCGFTLFTKEDCPRELALKGAGFRIPYFDLNGELLPLLRVRYLDPIRARRGDQLRLVTYSQPKGSRAEPYFSPLLDWAQPRPVTLITEGENKANCACKNGLPAIALAGVYNFSGKLTGDPLHPKLATFGWGDKPIYIVYDSDTAGNFQVARAENALAQALLETVPNCPALYIVRIPQLTPGRKTGLDDYLVAKGRDAFAELLAEAKPWLKWKVVHELNERLCYVREPSCVVELRDAKWRIMRCDTFTKEVYKPFKMKVPDPTKADPNRERTVSAAAEWLGSHARNVAEAMTYAPGAPAMTVACELNRWHSSGIIPKRGSIKLWRQLLDFLLASLTAEERLWLERWIAYPHQRPGTKLCSAVAVWGREQGTGKTLVGETLGMLYGATNWFLIEHMNLSEAFNAIWAEDKQFIVGDEVTARADNRRDGYNRMKSLITRRTIVINDKWKPIYATPDVMNYWFTSNDSDCFFMDREDRRLMIVEVRGKPLEDAFYQEFVRWRDEEGGLGALLYHYLHLDVGDFRPAARPPLTAAKAQMIEKSSTAAETWAYNVRTYPNKYLSLELEGSPALELYTSAELAELCRFHTAEEEQKMITNRTVGQALEKAGFRKVTCCAEGRMNLRGIKGVPYLWAMGGDVAKLAAEKDPEVIRKRYFEQRPGLALDLAKLAAKATQVVSDVPREKIQ